MTEPELALLANVTAKPVEWMWPGRIPLGAITLLIGDPGLGKSTISLAFAAHVSTGKPWPGCTEPREPAGVVLLGCEDSLEHTVRPRLDALGADCGRIAALRAVLDGKRRPVSLETDLVAVESALERLDATLLVIDPLSAYLGRNVNAWRDDDVRRVVDPLAELATRRSLAIVPLVHMTKASDRAALYRSQGSIAFVAAARSVLALATDPDEPDHKTKRVLVHVKSNLSLLADALALDVSPPLTWGDERRLAADDALAPRRTERTHQPTKVQACASVIEDVLRGAGVVGAEEARRLVRARMPCVSDSTIDRARSVAGVSYIRPATIGGHWLWSLGAERADETSGDDTRGTTRSHSGEHDHASRQPEERRGDAPDGAYGLAGSVAPVSSAAVSSASTDGIATVDGEMLARVGSIGGQREQLALELGRSGQ